MNIAHIRQDTKGCTDKLFFNSAGASLMPSVVVKKMKNYLDEEEEFGGYFIQSKHAEELQEVYTQAATLLHCAPKNIAITYNATNSFFKALSSIDFKEGDCILTTDDDYISNQLTFIRLQEKWKLQLIRGTNLPNGDLDLDDFEDKIKTYLPKLITVAHIPTNSGLIQPVEEVGALCKKYDILFLLDACQSVGQIDVDTEAIGCDYLCATGRKFLRGPRGIGLLYVSDKVLEKQIAPTFIDMSGAEWTGPNQYTLQNNAKRFETWEQSRASILGLKEALAYANTIGMKNIETYNNNLSKHLRSGLSKIPEVTLLDKGSKQCSIVTFTIKGAELNSLTSYLSSKQIYYSVSNKNAALIDFTKKEVDWAIRFSPHYFNTTEELDKAIAIVEAYNSKTQFSSYQ